MHHIRFCFVAAGPPKIFFLREGRAWRFAFTACEDESLPLLMTIGHYLADDVYSMMPVPH